ncbi:TPA: hypothetical protein HA293_06930, partial [Candidatus Woesearchaeota archaeon]|nr:hypothetical protein [Candidatus Woesearchaeota archaeon]
CNDGKDNDCDTKIDCNDPNCANNPRCIVQTCGDGTCDERNEDCSTCPTDCGICPPVNECDPEKDYCISDEQLQQYVSETTPIVDDNPSLTTQGTILADEVTEEDIKLLEYANTALKKYKEPAFNLLPDVNILNPTDGDSYISGTNIFINVSADDPDGTISRVELYIGHSFGQGGSGGFVNDTSYPYSMSFTPSITGLYNITAKAFDDLGASNSASVNISVTTNSPPIVSFLSPKNSASFLFGSNIFINISASDANGVAFVKAEYGDGEAMTMLGTKYAVPYSWTLSGLNSGSYVINAVATDVFGASSTATVRVVVNATNKVPVVSIIRPLNNSGFFTNGNVGINVSASDSDGSVSTVVVQYSSNGINWTYIGVGTLSPYNFVWNNIPQGKYIIRATATDNLGVKSYAYVTISVTTKNQEVNSAITGNVIDSESKYFDPEINYCPNECNPQSVYSTYTRYASFPSMYSDCIVENPSCDSNDEETNQVWVDDYQCCNDQMAGCSDPSSYTTISYLSEVTCKHLEYSPSTCIDNKTLKTCLPSFVYFDANRGKRTCHQYKPFTCGAYQTCESGQCKDIPDGSYYTPKDYGPLTPRTIYIDKQAMLLKYPQLENQDTYKFYISNDPSTIHSSDYLFRFQSVEKIAGKTFIKITYFPSRYGIVEGQAYIHLEDINKKIAYNVIGINIPEKVCSLLYGNGDINNLDLVMLGDNFDYPSALSLAIGADNLINPIYGGNNDIASGNIKLPLAYKNKINLWIRNTPGLGCELEDDKYGLGFDVVKCDKSLMEGYGSTCNYDINIALAKIGEGSTSLVKQESWINAQSVINVIYSIASGPVGLIYLAWSFTNRELFWSNNPDNIKGHTVALTIGSDKSTLWHELGHAFGGNLDYYQIDDDCVYHPCAMCNPWEYDFSDEQHCRDAYNMVESFNKGGYCDGIIEVSRIYPNPFNTASSNVKYRQAKVQVRAVYPSNADTYCYATLNVYNELGKLIRTIVSDYPLTPNMYSPFTTEGSNNHNYIFRWDGRNFNGDYVASGRYFFQVSMKNTRTTDSQKGDPLKVVLQK